MSRPVSLHFMAQLTCSCCTFHSSNCDLCSQADSCCCDGSLCRDSVEGWCCLHAQRLHLSFNGIDLCFKYTRPSPVNNSDLLTIVAQWRRDGILFSDGGSGDEVCWDCQTLFRVKPAFFFTLYGNVILCGMWQLWRTVNMTAFLMS